MRTNIDSTYFLCKDMYATLRHNVRHSAPHPCSALALRRLDRYPLLQAAQRSPCIVNVSSVAGVSSTGSGAIYAMSTAIAFRCHPIRQHSRECGNSALHPIRADLAGRRHAAQSTTRGTPRRAAGESVRMNRVCAAASAAFPPHTARRCA